MKLQSLNHKDIRCHETSELETSLVSESVGINCGCHHTREVTSRLSPPTASHSDREPISLFHRRGADRTNNRWSMGARLGAVAYCHRCVGLHFFARASASAICPAVIRMATASRDSAARFSP